MWNELPPGEKHPSDRDARVPLDRGAPTAVPAGSKPPTEGAAIATRGYPARPYLIPPSRPGVSPGAPSAAPHLAAGDGASHAFVRRARGAAEHTAEIVNAIALALACFVVLLVVMNRIFPTSTGLGEMMFARGGDDGERGSNPGLVGFRGLGSLVRWTAASLTVLDNEVLWKASGAIEWAPVRGNARISEGDGVQTTRGGMALVTFDANNHLRLGRNSLIILRRPETAPAGEPVPAVSLQLVSGEMWGEFGGVSAGPVRVEVGSGSANTSVQIDGSERGSQARFRVATREGSSSIAVFNGEAQVSVAGRVVPVKAREYMLLNGEGTASRSTRLPDPPAPAAPADDAQYSYRELPPLIRFQWGSVAGADGYRLTIGRDPVFREIALEERTDGNSLQVGRLAVGDYWWRLTSTRGGVDSPPSPSRRLSMRLDRNPPHLQVDFPAARTAEDAYAIAGVAEPGSKLFVGGTRVEVGQDGRFRCSTPLHLGMNLVVVEAVDEVGNTSYRSKAIERVAPDGGDRTP